MPRKRCLLTGATGCLGRYLLRDLLVAGQDVTVLARPKGTTTAAHRIEQIVAYWEERLRQPLPRPLVIECDQSSFNVSGPDRRWLGRTCQRVVHAAANLSFTPTATGEPFATNVTATSNLLRLVQGCGLREWHHVSTAFVCGKRPGPIDEDTLDAGAGFHNPYEDSKFQAETLVRRAAGLTATIYRPALIIGDSQTGYTSTYTGLYRFLELAARLSQASARATNPVRASRRLLPMRLPLDGTEMLNLVPVDWVSRVIAELIARPEHHGRTYHLASPHPVPSSLVRELAGAELGLEGVDFVGRGPLANPTQLEETFLEGIAQYWPYLPGMPVFSIRNTRAAVPHLPAPRAEGEMLRRVLRFAVADNWGRRAEGETSSRLEDTACRHYMEKVFPEKARRSQIARAVELSQAIGFDIRGEGGGQWTCRWEHGAFCAASRGIRVADVVYRMDVATFQAIVAGQLSPRHAFFQHQISITGDLERALKLVALFEQFLQEQLRLGREEVEHVAA